MNKLYETMMAEARHLRALKERFVAFVEWDPVEIEENRHCTRQWTKASADDCYKPIEDELKRRAARGVQGALESVGRKLRGEALKTWNSLGLPRVDDPWKLPIAQHANEILRSDKPHSINPSHIDMTSAPMEEPAAARRLSDAPTGPGLSQDVVTRKIIKAVLDKDVPDVCLVAHGKVMKDGELPHCDECRCVADIMVTKTFETQVPSLAQEWSKRESML